MKKASSGAEALENPVAHDVEGARRERLLDLPVLARRAGFGGLKEVVETGELDDLEIGVLARLQGGSNGLEVLFR